MAERYSKSIQRRQLGNFRTVTPANVKVNNAEAQAWGQVAQSSGKLYSQFAKYALEDAKHQAIIDAEGIEFAKDETGLTVMPPPMTEGGSVYNKNYQSVVNNMYKREIKTDIETRLSQIFTDTFYEPEKMESLFDNSLSSIIENISPEHQTTMMNVGTQIKNSYLERSRKAKVHQIYNMNVDNLNSQWDPLVDKRLVATSQNDILSANEALSENLNERIKLGLIHPDQAEEERRYIQYFVNYDSLKTILNLRDDEGGLINDVEDFEKIGQMFRGHDETAVELVDQDGNIQIYTKETIDKLVPNLDLRNKIGIQLDNRANYLAGQNTQTEFSKNYARWLTIQSNPKISGIISEFTDAENVKFMDYLINENYDISNFVNNLGSNQDVNATKIVELLGVVKEFDIFPSSLQRMFEGINTASAEDIGKFHLGAYHAIQRDKNLKELWATSNIDPRIKGIYATLSSVIGLNESPERNAEIINDILPKVKMAYNKEQVENLNNLILADDDGKFDGTKRIAKTNVFDYMTTVLAIHNDKLDVNAMVITPEHKIQILDEVQQYLTSRTALSDSKPTIDELDQIIIDVAKSVTKNIETDGGYIGPKHKKEDNLGFYNHEIHENLTLFNNTDQNKTIKNLADNIDAVGGDIKNVYVDYAVARALNGILDNPLDQEQTYRLSNFNAENTRSSKELYKRSISNEMDYLGTMIETDKGYDSKMYEGNTVLYKDADGVQQEAIMVLGVTYTLGKNDNGTYNIVLIDDEGGPTTNILGIAEDANGTPIELDLQSLKSGKQSEINEYQKWRAFAKEVNDITDKQKAVTTDLSSGVQNEDIDTESIMKDSNNKIIKLLNDMDKIKKDQEGQEVDPDGTLFRNISFVTEVPMHDNNTTASIVSRFEGKGAATVHDSAELVASALPAGNYANVKRHLIETAWVESNFGTIKQGSNYTAFSRSSDYGIWQNQESMGNLKQELFKRGYPNSNVKDGKLVTNAKVLEQLINDTIPNLNFKFINMTREDLAIPLISASVARLHYALFDGRPSSSFVKGDKGRAQSYATNYNTKKGASKGSPDNYIKRLQDDEFNDALSDLIKERMNIMYLPKKTRASYLMAGINNSPLWSFSPKKFRRSSFMVGRCI